MLAMFADRGRIVLDSAGGQQHPKFVSTKHGSQQFVPKGALLMSCFPIPVHFRMRIAGWRHSLRGEVIVIGKVVQSHLGARVLQTQKADERALPLFERPHKVRRWSISR
jgi:hypothetical protein